MATKIRPIFVSAPQIRLYIDNTVIAYAIGINLNVNIDAQSVYTFGEYGPVNVEPLQYGIVTGTLQIVKLAASVLGGKDVLAQRVALSDELKAADGKGVFKDPGETVTLPGGNSNSPLVNTGLARHIDPKKVLFSQTFDMEIKLSHQTDDNPPKLIDASLLEVKNCRLSGVNMNISLGALVNEPLSFQGLLLIDREKDNPVQEKHDSGRKEGG